MENGRPDAGMGAPPSAFASGEYEKRLTLGLLYDGKKGEVFAMRGAWALGWAAVMLGLVACGGPEQIKGGSAVASASAPASALVKPQEPLPKATKGRFAVLIAGLDGDEDRNKDGVGDASRTLVQEFLRLNRDTFGVEAPGAERSFEILSTRRVIQMPKGGDELRMWKRAGSGRGGGWLRRGRVL